ncbi:MAG: 4-hydroxy-tetrahydrodipicolinate synthase [Clostridia bacterium]
MFRGLATALITPFNSTGVDYKSLEKLLEAQIEGNVDALVILGTTGEPATMTNDEKKAVIDFVIKKVNKRVPVIVGAGSNCTATAVANSISAEKQGADALLIVTPYYNKCTQEGLFRHYEAVAKAVHIPVFIYNVPGRTAVNILPQTARRIASLPNICGIKEACGKMDQIKETARVIASTKMRLFSGDDGLATEIIKLGADGLISVASNCIPKEMSQLVHLALDKKFDEANAMQAQLAPFIKALFSEVNPIPAKFACYKLGLCENVLRLPLTPMSKAKSNDLLKCMESMHIGAVENN